MICLDFLKKSNFVAHREHRENTELDKIVFNKIQLGVFPVFSVSSFTPK